MKRFLTRTLAGRLIVVMLVAVGLSQGVSLLVHHFERDYALRCVLRDECLGRVALGYRLMMETPTEQRENTLERIGTPLTRYWISGTMPETPEAWQETAREKLLQNHSSSGSVNRFGNDPALSRVSRTEWQTLSPDAWLLRLPVKMLPLPEWNGFGFTVQLNDGTWLHTVTAKPDYLVSSTFTPGYYIALAFTILVFLLAAFHVSRRISLPLRHLSAAAEKLGRGEEIDLLPESGPDDIRSTVAAFNRMQIRLHRFVEDRIRMLAAIGHDLRTPLTSLRLRSEFVSEPEVREKLLATIDEMQAMTESALAFARSEAASEPTRKVDLNALLESLCDDLVELGWNVAFTEGQRVTCNCRPDSLRRAVRNVIENAVRYGDQARVSLQPSAEGVDILVDDDGPGIPEELREKVFSPFVRLEASRNRNTGGVGLGLSIARSILRGHGGEITLVNGPQGFRVQIHLLCN
ncbi:MAG: ATP-binding protein [Luteolibacter sp.]